MLHVHPQQHHQTVPDGTPELLEVMPKEGESVQHGTEPYVLIVDKVGRMSSPVKRMARTPNHAGRRQYASLRLILFHFIPVVAMALVIVTLTVDPSSLSDLLTFDANLVKMLSGIDVPSHSLRPNQKVDDCSNGTSEGVSRLVVKSLYKGLPSIVVQVLGGAEVEVRIKFMDDCHEQKL